MGPINLLLIGMLLGMRHALEPDHLASVATITSETHSVYDGIKQGAVWGVGHSLTLLLFGGAVLALGGRVPEQAAAWLELAVGVMLVGLGIDAIRRAMRSKLHLHAHEHADGARHIHLHSHEHLEGHQHPHPDSLTTRALLVGLMHGLAGSAALVLIAAVSAPSVGSGLLYILAFGAGSILGMGVLSAVIALPLRLASRGPIRFLRRIRIGLGVVTILIGLGIIGSFAAAIA